MLLEFYYLTLPTGKSYAETIVVALNAVLSLIDVVQNAGLAGDLAWYSRYKVLIVCAYCNSLHRYYYSESNFTSHWVTFIAAAFALGSLDDDRFPQRVLVKHLTMEKMIGSPLINGQLQLLYRVPLLIKHYSQVLFQIIPSACQHEILLCGLSKQNRDLGHIHTGHPMS